MGSDSGAIREIKERIDIVELVRRYVDLRPVSGRFVGPCPFHQETKGSFSVNPERGFYYCFGCQAKGDAIDFYKRINGLEFREALEALASQTGVQLGTAKADPQTQKKREIRKAALEMHALAEKYFIANLAGGNGRPCRDYLKQRKTEKSILEMFSIGYSLDDWQGLKDTLAARGFSPLQGVEAGLLSKSDKGRVYDRFRGRLIFPIHDVGGKVIAFGGRIIGDGDPKYLNSSDSPIYKKGEHLYGLYQSRRTMTRSRRALLTEGYMDVLSLHQFGFTDAVGVLGTALTPEQVKRLSGFCNRIDLVFDGDAPGRKAAFRSAELILAHGLTCRVVLLPDGKDVDDLLHEGGKDAFEACLAEAEEGLSFCVNEIKATQSAREIVDWAKKFVQGLSNAEWKAYFIPRLADGLNMTSQDLRKAVGEEGDNLPSPNLAVVKNAGRQPEKAAPLRDKQLLEFVVRFPHYREACEELRLEAALSTDWAKRFWDKLIMHQDNTLFSELDDNEQDFYAKASLMDEDAVESDVLWTEISTFLVAERTKDREKNLRMALMDAQIRGDDEEAGRLLVALNAELCGRVDEQS